MAQRKILLDSNAYLRLAQTIHPLLHVEFGEERHCLYVIRELQQEFDRSARLQTKFHWVNEPEYAANRRRTITIPRKAAKQIAVTISVIEGEARTRELGVSPVDARALATASALEVPLVTDDGDMLALAEAFEIGVMKTLELLRLDGGLRSRHDGAGDRGRGLLALRQGPAQGLREGLPAPLPEATAVSIVLRRP